MIYFPKLYIQFLKPYLYPTKFSLCVVCFVVYECPSKLSALGKIRFINVNIFGGMTIIIFYEFYEYDYLHGVKKIINFPSYKLCLHYTAVNMRNLFMNIYK